MSGVEPAIIASALNAAGSIGSSLLAPDPDTGRGMTDPAQQRRQAQMALLQQAMQQQQQPQMQPMMQPPQQPQLPDVFTFLRSMRGL